jgi:hypothetical protein
MLTLTVEGLRYGETLVLSLREFHCRETLMLKT